MPVFPEEPTWIVRAGFGWVVDCGGGARGLGRKIDVLYFGLLSHLGEGITSACSSFGVVLLDNAWGLGFEVFASWLQEPTSVAEVVLRGMGVLVEPLMNGVYCLWRRLTVKYLAHLRESGLAEGWMKG